MDSSNKKDEIKFSEQIAKKEKRKMIGWSVAIPTLLGAALGIWLDKHYPETFSWVLSFLMIGLITGCIIAWYWVDKEDKQMHQNQDENDE